MLHTPDAHVRRLIVLKYTFEKSEEGGGDDARRLLSMAFTDSSGHRGLGSSQICNEGDGRFTARSVRRRPERTRANTPSESVNDRI